MQASDVFDLKTKQKKHDSEEADNDCTAGFGR